MRFCLPTQKDEDLRLSRTTVKTGIINLPATEKDPYRKQAKQASMKHL